MDKPRGIETFAGSGAETVQNKYKASEPIGKVNLLESGMAA